MAIVEAGTAYAVRMDEVDFGGLREGVLNMSPTSIRFVYGGVGSYTAFTGSFSFDTVYVNGEGETVYDDLSGGTVTGIVEYEEGVMTFRIRGLSIPALTFAAWVQNGQALQAKIVGLAGDDQITGSPFDDLLEGWAGNDRIEGAAGADDLYGMDGDDILIGGEGDDVFYGGAGGDTMTGGNGIDRVSYAGVGSAVTVDLKSGATGGGGADILSGIENLIGSGHADTLTGSFASNEISGGAGDDIIYGEENADILRGDDGVDTLEGGFGDDDLYGGAGGDTLQGDEGIDELYGESGDDFLISVNGAGENSAFVDRLYGGAGADFYIMDAGDRVEEFAADDDALVFVTPYPLGNVQIVTTDGKTEIRAWTTDLSTYESIWIESGIDPALLAVETYSSGGENGVILTRVAPPPTRVEQVVIDLPTVRTDLTATTSAALPTLKEIFLGDIQDELIDYITDHENFARAMSEAMRSKIVFEVVEGVAQKLGKYYDLSDQFELAYDIGTYLNDAFIDPYLWGQDGKYQNPDGTQNVAVHVETILEIIASTVPFGDTLIKIGGSIIVEIATEIFELAQQGIGEFGALLSDYLTAAKAGEAQNQTTDGDDLQSKGDGVTTYAGGGGDDTQLGTGIPADAVAAPGSGEATAALPENDTFDGGAGVDSLLYSFAVASVEVNLATGVATGTEIGTDTVLNIENVSTGRGDDRITGSAGANRLDGGAGADLLTGGGGDDLLRGGSGNDVLNGGDGTDTADYSEGTSGVRVELLRTAAQNTRGAGTDTLSQIENLNGSAHADQLIGSQVGNRLEGAGGNDVLIGLGGADILIGGAGDDYIHNNDDLIAPTQSDGVADTLQGGEGNDVVDAGRGDIADGGAGFDRLTVYAVSEATSGWTADFSALADVQAALAAAYGGTFTGFETFGFSGTNFNDHIIGHNNSVTDLLDSTLEGWGGNDTLEGRGGRDILLGGTGDDLLLGGDGDDLLRGGAGVDVLNGGAGIDTADYSAAAAGIRAQLNTNASTNDGDGGSDTFSGIENLTGSAFDDILTGDGLANLLRGGAGADTLTGNQGNDSLNGGGGADTMAGGLGDDTYFVDSIDDVLQEFAGEGRDFVYASNTFRLRTNDDVELLIADPRAGTSALNLAGNGIANLIFGNDGVNILEGGGGDDALFGYLGNDTLNGGLGVDTMAGGLGDDTYFIDTIDDVLQEFAGQGRDIVYTNVSFRLRDADDIELLVVDQRLGTSALNLAGNGIANLIFGNDGANILEGGGGDDALFGYLGNDTLNGGLGVDTMVGGLGDDVYFIDTIDDVLQEFSGEGRDIVYTTVNFRLRDTDDIELLVADPRLGTSALNLAGNGIANLIFGNDGVNILEGGGGNDALFGYLGNDTLNGGLGVDTMVGGLGDDIYFIDTIDDVLQEFSGEGRDIVYTTVNFRLRDTDDIELLVADPRGGTSALNLAGNGIANLIFGNDGANILEGGGGNDALFGYLGNDTLNGGLGVDTMAGGLGDDIYFIDTIDDVLQEFAGEGRDFVYSTVSYRLRASDDIEVLLADPRASTAAINLTGNDLVNSLFGNAGANILDGKGGNDVLTGNEGADSYGFSSALNGVSNVDTILGFSVAEDKVLLGAAGGQPFAGLTAGTLAASAFTIGSAATTADHRIIYDAANGNLFFDADGSGAGAAIQFANIGVGLALTASHFTVTGTLAGAPEPSGKDSAADPQVLPGLTDDGFVILAKGGDAPLVLPGAGEFDELSGPITPDSPLDLNQMLTVGDNGELISGADSLGGRHDHDGWLF